MFEHRMRFVNKSNFPVNIAIKNSGVIHDYRNSLAPGGTFDWSKGWPIGYDIYVFHDTEATRIDPVRDNVLAIAGYVMIGGSVIAAAVAGLIEVASIGVATPIATGVAAGAVATFTGGVALVSGTIAIGSIVTEIVAAALNPAKFTGLLGTDNYTIEIAGSVQARTADIADGQVTKLGLDFDPIALRWRNDTSGTSGSIGQFLWVWGRNPIAGAVRDVCVMPDGTILGIGMDNFLWRRTDLASPWEQVSGSALPATLPEEYGAATAIASFVSVAALGDGSIVGLFKNVDGTSDTLVRQKKSLDAGDHWIELGLGGGGRNDAISVFASGEDVFTLSARGVSQYSATTRQWEAVQPIKAGVKYILKTSNDLVLGVHKNGYVVAGTDGYAGAMSRIKDDRKMIGLAQLKNGRIIGVDENHALFLAETFHELLAVG